ncbi:response regulator [Methylobacterium brachythecii]|uniref:CheY-like chemotaxis protein n=1 Tax=Methylobacterium brachythecii TaxID=1176177 RepID=A0A7W6AJE2_9HYPH|nr:response regulator [Methylobacterium brachythecii]MBB3904480.1 CheY-like chemotaxis protein [Methylobacterium brachythecii]GLS47082.1 hypothetical protein GCM10007884_50840 [Methylobacterium brachythecii]
MSIEQTETGINDATQGTRILLIEDDPDTQELIRALCEGRGDSVDTAADGFLGLRLLSERRHEIVLIDYHLPEMDGYALARLMRELGRPEGRLRLVGVTADRHGLASRRGADTLFDAILVKPLDPQTLFVTLDRLTQPEAMAEPAHPADELWRRRGLSARPRAILCPPPSASEAEAVAQAFSLAGPSTEASVVLVSDESGLEGLRGLRAEGANGLLPAFDLTGRLGASCDGVFQVGNPESWTALAQTVAAFGQRGAALAPGTRSASDARTRLAALMFVADRELRLSAGDEATALAYETGHSKTSLMAAVLQLMEAGTVTCQPVAGGVSARLTQAGRDTLTMGDREPEPSRRASRPNEAVPHPLDRPIETLSSAAAAMSLNVRRLEELNGLVGSQRIDVLLARLSKTLDTAFEGASDRQAIAGQAHTLISSAGNLGFDDLAHTCRALQEAIMAGRDETPYLRAARRAASDAKTHCTQGLALLMPVQ